MTKNTSAFKQQLEKELQLLEGELKSVGRVNPDNPKDWEATPPIADNEELAEREEVAQKFEGYEENTAILKDLEIRYNEVKAALDRIEKGTYGICSVCGKEIEEDRLKANPAATTCKQHMG